MPSVPGTMGYRRVRDLHGPIVVDQRCVEVVAEIEVVLTLNCHLQHLQDHQVLMCMLRVTIGNVPLRHHKSLETLALCMRYRHSLDVSDLQSA